MSSEEDISELERPGNSTTGARKERSQGKRKTKIEVEEEVTWTNDEIEGLIDAVRECKILYEIASKDNKNSGSKDLSWLEVSEKCRKPGETGTIKDNGS